MPAIKRRPALILVDELAHTNVAGSRHPKRWQDIEELLASGIDVFTTLNVQHLESLNDVVGGITGITVRETVPDTFFDNADEVMLVDIPADDLLARLAAGKVYVPEQIERAARNFFRKGNLMALRELALRRTADRVEDDVQAYRSDQAIDASGKPRRRFSAASGRSGRTTWCAARRASPPSCGVEWTAVYVETPALQRLPAARARTDPANVEARAGTGRADGDLCPATNPVPALHRRYARTHNCSKVVVGRWRAEPATWP